MSVSDRSPHLILASASPRRAELLRQIGVPFEQCPVDLDESVLPSESAQDYVRRLALAKAKAAWRIQQTAGLADDGLVLGSDTSVVLEGRILGKPSSREDCIRMLEALAGRSHHVMTAIALLGGQLGPWVELVVSRVSFRDISRPEMDAYWQSGEPGDKAGGYAIQGKGAIFVQRIEGSYSGVMGLPVFETANLLSRAGVDLWLRAKGVAHE